jgi:hypothetical protein
MGAPHGNKNSTNAASLRDAIRYELAKVGRELEGDEPALKKGMRAIAEPQVKAALAGELSAFRELSDRIDGKPAQSVDLSGEVNLPLSGTVKFVGSDE